MAKLSHIHKTLEVKINNRKKVVIIVYTTTTHANTVKLENTINR